MDFLDLDSLALPELLVKRRSLRRRLLEQTGLQPLRVAVLGGTTTQELVELLELFLLGNGFAPTFSQSRYGQFYEEAVHGTGALAEFRPDLVYVHTSYVNLRFQPGVAASEAELAAAVAAELGRFREVWAALHEGLGCQVIQNNFELPAVAPMGSLEAVVPGGAVRYVAAVNEAFAREAAEDPRLLLHDVCTLSARVGLERWFDADRWFSYKLPVTAEASVAMAKSLCAIVRSLYGRARKVLVLDLDNTVWGGVIGDDGVSGLVLGRETPLAEAFTAFGEYCLRLRERGVLLAVCSKNEDAVARSGFTHPDAVLKLEHFAAFRANWEPKHENLQALAAELNLGVDSFVFADDNPAERALVRAQLPGVAVPELGDNPAQFPAILQAGRYFEAVSLSGEDLRRASLYAGNAQRNEAQAAFADYGAYLGSLEMVAEVGRFQPMYFERITQLTNKTNQFNLTGRRYTAAEIAAAADDAESLGLYGRLADRFGDHGLVSVVLGRREGEALRLDLWLMSCRVLKREMELAMLDALAARAQADGLTALIGVYVPTKKNGMVAGFYRELGFAPVEVDAATGAGTWRLELAGYVPRTAHIGVKAG